MSSGPKQPSADMTSPAPTASNKLLTPEEQQHKNAMWPLYMEAKAGGRRASFRGCNLFVDSQLVLGPLQARSQWDFHDALMHALPEDQAFHPMPVSSNMLPPYHSPNLFTNPLAQPHPVYASQHASLQEPPAWIPHQPPRHLQQQPHLRSASRHTPTTPIFMGGRR